MATRSARASVVSVDTSGLDAKLKSVSRREFPFILKESMNGLAFNARRMLQNEAIFTFDRPTPWTLRRFHVIQRASKSRPVALLSAQGRAREVTANEGREANRIISPHVEGGLRLPRPSEYRFQRLGILQPGEYLVGAAPNQYGNVPGSEYQRALRFFSAGRAVRSSSGSSQVAYFVRRGPGGGAILRTRGRGRPKLIWRIVRRRSRYRRVFDVYDLAQRHARQWAGHFGDKAIRRAKRTAR